MYYSIVLALLASLTLCSAEESAPVYDESVVTSQRHGDNFAYSVTNHGAYMHGGKPVAISRALTPGQFSAYSAGSYVSPVGAGAGHYFGAVHNPVVAQHGISAYAAQPVAYSGQPFVYSHQAVAPGVVGVPQHHYVKQVHQV